MVGHEENQGLRVLGLNVIHGLEDHGVHVLELGGIQTFVLPVPAVALGQIPHGPVRVKEEGGVGTLDIAHSQSGPILGCGRGVQEGLEGVFQRLPVVVPVVLEHPELDPVFDPGQAAVEAPVEKQLGDVVLGLTLGQLGCPVDSQEGPVIHKLDLVAGAEKQLREPGGLQIGPADLLGEIVRHDVVEIQHIGHQGVGPEGFRVPGAVGDGEAPLFQFPIEFQVVEAEIGFQVLITAVLVEEQVVDVPLFSGQDLRLRCGRFRSGGGGLYQRICEIQEEA